MYKFTIKKFEDNFIVLSNEDNSVEVSLSDFSDEFYLTRNFPFSDHFLPKVLAYYSPIFEYENSKHAYLITQMRPTIRESVNKDIYFPWSFFFVLVNLDTNIIVESHLFFGKNQMMSEDYHQFYVPKVKEENLGMSPFFSSKINSDVLSFFSAIPCKYEKQSFGSLINDLYETSLEVFLEHHLNTVDFVHSEELKRDSDKEKIEKKFSTYWLEDSCFQAEWFDTFGMEQHQNPPTFLDITKHFLEK